MSLLHKIRSDDGQALVFAAISMVAIIAFLGLAIDVGHFRLVKRNLQNAADAVALAGALEVRACGGGSDCGAMQSAARSAMAENGFPAVTLLTGCSSTTGDGVTLILNNPACAIAADPNLGKLDYVEAVVTDKVPTYFAGMLGIRSETISARAEAARIGGPCIIALGGQPGGPYEDAGAITMVAGVLVHSNCPVWDESQASDALECTVSVGVTAPQINVSGGTAGLLGTPISLCGLWTTRAHTNVPAPHPHDPLSYLAAPPNANDSCGSRSGNTWNGSPSQVNIALMGIYVLNPGVYCGGINITAALGAKITFNPGTYILRQTHSGVLGTGVLANGGLNITVAGLSAITGNGVTFYNESGPSTITVPEALGLSSFDLSAPTSGEYGGILFYQPASNTSADTFLVSVTQGGVFNGAIYAPNAAVSYGVNALSSDYNILVARDINFLAAVASEFGNNYGELSGGSPLNGTDVMLVQ